jgi:hypothetical protein
MFGQTNSSRLQDEAFGVSSSSPLFSTQRPQSRGVLMVNDNSHLRTVVNQDGAAVLDTKQGSIATLNSTGAYVWQGLERGESLETIIANLSRATGAQPEVVGRDVRDFVETLRTQQLLSIDDAKEFR